MKNQLALLSFTVLVFLTFDLTSGQQSNVAASIKGVKGTMGTIATMGGGITLYRDLTPPKSNKTLKTAEIGISFLRLAELGADKQVLVDKNNKTHVMTNFDKMSFTCQFFANNTMAFSSNVKGDCWKCSASMVDIFSEAQFKITACVVQENGTITQSQEQSNVKEGLLKLSIDITKGWPWCDSSSCTKNGTYLDLDIGIKLPANISRVANATSPKTDQKPARFELGAGVSVEFSAMSWLDSKFVSLVDNTPTLSQTNTSSNVSLRFNRFDNLLTYDPIFDTGSLAYDPNSSVRLGVMSLPALLFISMATVWVTSRII